jgi:hypothetical protein
MLQQMLKQLVASMRVSQILLGKNEDLARCHFNCGDSPLVSVKLRCRIRVRNSDPCATLAEACCAYEELECHTVVN